MVKQKHQLTKGQLEHRKKRRARSKRERVIIKLKLKEVINDSATAFATATN